MKATRLAILVVAFAAACAEAGGDVKGGELTDAGWQAVTPGSFTAVYDAGTDCGEGDTWSSLYRDIFGNGKPGSCTYDTYCHGTPDGKGAKKWMCLDEAGCREGMIGYGLIRTSGSPTAGKNLFSYLKRIDPATGKPTGTMPQAPGDYVYPQACFDRIQSWVIRGAPAD